MVVSEHWSPVASACYKCPPVSHTSPPDVPRTRLLYSSFLHLRHNMSSFYFFGNFDVAGGSCMFTKKTIMTSSSGDRTVRTPHCVGSDACACVPFVGFRARLVSLQCMRLGVLAIHVGFRMHQHAAQRTLRRRRTRGRVPLSIAAGTNGAGARHTARAEYVCRGS